MANADNKGDLIKLFFDEWKKELNISLLCEEVYLYITSLCLIITQVSIMFLQAKHISDAGYDKIDIMSPDTDVAVFFLAFVKDISCLLYVNTKKGKSHRLININNMKDLCTDGNDLCDTSLRLHTFTGCDTISASAGKGTVKGFTIVTA